MDIYPEQQPVAEVDPSDVVAMGSAIVLIDVRELDEWEAGHAAYAEHVPVGQVEAGWLPGDSRLPLAIVCRSGARSMRAARVLSAAGFDVVNVRGGMRAWDAAGQVLVTNNGTVGAVA